MKMEKLHLETRWNEGIAKKVEVTLGNADAENQVTSGLSKDDKVIINPTAD